MKLKPIKKHIVFKFNEAVDSKGFFEKKTSWGLEIRGSGDDSAKAPRWVTVVAVGPDCELIKPGDQVLVKPLKWSIRFNFDGEQLWRTDETQLIAVDTVSDYEDKKIHNFRAMNKSVVFLRTDKQKSSVGGIEIVGRLNDDTAFGQVVDIGPDVYEVPKGATIYFLENNFFGYFEYRSKKFCYLDELEILAYVAKE